MISVEEARARILAQVMPLPPEQVPLLDALGRIATADVAAGLNIPPFDNSAMDGYAVIAADVQLVPATLRVTGHAPAGAPVSVRVSHGEAVRIMTGAPLPAGADAVVRFEHTSEGLGARGHGTRDLGQAERGGDVQVLVAVQAGENIRRAGEDVTQGVVVIRAGALIRPQEVGMLAALGQASVMVHRQPRVAILATGDELVSIDEPIGPGQIRNINEYSTAALVRRSGGIPLCLGIARDRLDHLTAKVEEGLALAPDLFLTSAGVSVGDFDMVKDVLASEGHIEFWSVAMKPGKPMAFGSLRGVPLVGLPGNPVAAMVSFEQFVRPALLKMAGWVRWQTPTVRAVVREEIENSGRRNFVRAVVTREDGVYYARTTGEQGSGVLTSLVRANGLLVVPEGVARLRPGDAADVQMLDWSDTVF
ncbi:MAG: molybdopterin molybdotransferase MoeA [Chloroflexi bacterium]|nr:molybdopterin molybdotransferase MoeA [Chloroflexota bacterium]